MAVMMPPRKIIAAVDLSEPSLAALAAAKDLAARAYATLEVVYAQSPDVPLRYSYDELDMTAAEAMREEQRRFKKEWHVFVRGHAARHAARDRHSWPKRSAPRARWVHLGGGLRPRPGACPVRAGIEEFMVSWAQEFPLHEPLALVVHLKGPADDEAARTIEPAIHHYFAYKADLTRLELRRLLSLGRVSLAIAVLFLGLCLLVGQAVGRRAAPIGGVLKEGLTIAGWVAMWRPMQIYLYDWWPLLRKGRIFAKMSTMKVEVVGAKAHPV